MSRQIEKETINLSVKLDYILMIMPRCEPEQEATLEDDLMVAGNEILISNRRLVIPFSQN